MQKLIPAALALVMLSGCGAHGLAGATSVNGAALAAQSKAQAEKAIHAMFRASFKAADKNGDKKLTLDEMPGVLPTPVVAGLEAPASDEAKAMFAKLDLNKDGHVGYREFASKDNQANALAVFRGAVAKKFAELDKNKDHFLGADELKGTEFELAKIDAGKKPDGKLTISEFENGFAAAQSRGTDPFDPPAVDPNAPAAPAVDPAPPAPPAPPAVDPNAPPAPTNIKKK
jgi:hypothetical protein